MCTRFPRYWRGGGPSQLYSCNVNATIYPYNLPPRLSLEKRHLLPETTMEVHQTKGGQEVGHLLITEILHLPNVCIQVPHDNGVLPQEAVENLL